MLSKYNPKIMKKETNHLPRTLEPTPTLSLLAIEGWAYSNGLFNLSKDERA
jgi:hypothetical protein